MGQAVQANLFQVTCVFSSLTKPGQMLEFT